MRSQILDNNKNNRQGVAISPLLKSTCVNWRFGEGTDVEKDFTMKLFEAEDVRNGATRQGYLKATILMKMEIVAYMG